MMKLARIIFVSAFILALSGAAFAEAPAGVINNFALNAGKILSQSEGTFFFSPFSIITAFGMAYTGASGDTAAEIEKVLGFNQGFHGDLGGFVRDIDKSGQISSANRVWLRNGLTLNKDFQSTLYLFYNSEPEELDFMNATEASRVKINDWVSSKTNNRINNLLRNLEPETQMILTNAVYFNARWEKTFNKERTASEDFYDGEKVVKVPMMKKHDNFDFAEFDGVKILRLPYEQGRMSMIAVLPPKESDDKNFLETLDAETLKHWISSLDRYEVDLWLPKFKTEKRYELKNLFEALGVKLAFSDFADFSGMTDDEKLKIDAIIHQTFIDVDEEKTEAAAATAIVMLRATAMPNKPKLAEFHADHPFIYFIVDNYTGTILFMGRQTFEE